MGVTVQSSLKLFDAMSGPLKNITNGMNLMVSTMYKMQNAANRNADIDKALIAAKNQIASAEAEINRQINNAQQSQKRFNNSVDKGVSKMYSLGFAVIAVNEGIELMHRGWAFVEKTMHLSDEMTATNARLALINDGLRTQAELQKQVFDVANRTRQSYVATADLITKVGAGTQGVFKNDNELLKFAEQFNKSLVISGATAVESSSAILQMSQALGSGVLQGDELRSLSETAPVLMRILADGLGVARGQLKQMGADGELTSDKIVKAFQNQSDKIDKMFSGIPMTFGGAMTILANTFKTWFGTLNQADGPLTKITDQVVLLTSYFQSDAGQRFMNGLAEGISIAVSWIIQLVQWVVQVYTFFSDNWSTIEPIIWGIVSAFAAWKLITLGVAVAQGINAVATYIQTAATIGLVAAWKALNAAMKANIIIIIISVIIGLITWLINLWNTNDKFAAALMRTGNTILNFFNQVPIFFVRVGYGIVNAFNDAKVKSLIIMENLVNGVIDNINYLIAKLNKIPGVSIKFVDGVNFSAESQIQAEAQRQAGEQKIAAMEKDAASKAAAREKKVQDMLDSRSEKRAKTEAEKQKKLQGIGTGTGTSLFDPTIPEIANIDKVNKVGKIEDKVDISSEDLKMMRELAEMKSIQNFVTLQPSVNLTTGPVTKDADVDEILHRIEKTLMEDIASGAAGHYA